MAYIQIVKLFFIPSLSLSVCLSVSLFHYYVDVYIYITFGAYVVAVVAKLCHTEKLFIADDETMVSKNEFEAECVGFQADLFSLFNVRYFFQSFVLKQNTLDCHCIVLVIFLT